MSKGRDSAIVYIEGLLQNLSNPSQSKPTIFEVDDRLREVNKKDYEPEIIAIGPIHGRKKHLQKMEQHKVRYLQQLLQRRADVSIVRLVENVRAIGKNALQCYSTTPDVVTDEFVVMLLLDGCFLIELIRKYFFNDSTGNDPVFESETLSQIRHDLMLFENQLPFFVLNMLFDMTKNNGPENDIRHLVVFLVGDMLPWSDVLKLDSPPDALLSADHLLGLMHTCFSPFSTRSNPSKTRGKKGRNPHVHIYSASELKEAGVGLKRSKGNSLIFKGGDLKLPPLQVSGNTESLLRNLMAYEQLRLGGDHKKHVTDYAFFMHCLIRSPKDIEILRRAGIITNYLGGDDKIFHMFDRLVTNFLRSSDFCYSDVFERLNSHCGRRREKWMAKLWREYFNSPWSLLSFIAAVLLLGISIAQVVFAILTFQHKKDVVKVHFT